MPLDPEYFLSKANHFRNIADQNRELDDQELEFDQEVDDEFYTDSGPESNCIKSQFKRFYDPISKHYFKTDKIFGAPIVRNVKPNSVTETDVWYPENKPLNRIKYDPKSGKYVMVDKLYDSNGNYAYHYRPIKHSVTKVPGTNYYKSVHEIK